MEFVFERDPRRYAELVQPLFDERLELNLLATVLYGVLEGRFATSEPLLARALDERGELIGIAMRTAPWPMLCSELEPDAAGELIDAWLDVDPDVPGVNSVAATSRAVAAAWERRTGGSTARTMATALHTLGAVRDPPRPAAGRLALAGEEDAAMLVEWWRAFGAEAGTREDADAAAAAVRSRLDHQGAWLWLRDDGLPVSLVATNPPVAGVLRIGPVYTPPQYRRRGYAGTAVAALSRRALADGARGCALFTDLANPTSNKIYAEVGYERVADWEQHLFEPPPGARS